MASVSATRERILKAAHELFSSKGYQGSSTRDIAQQASVAEVTLFRHFTTKEALFDVVIDRLMATATIDEVLPEFSDMPFENGVRLLARIYLAKISNNRNWLNICQTELRRDPETIHQLYGSFMDQLTSLSTGYFRGAAQRGEIKTVDPETATRVFMLLCFGYSQLDELLPAHDCHEESGKKLLDDMVWIFVNGITGRVTANSEQQTSIESTHIRAGRENALSKN